MDNRPALAVRRRDKWYVTLAICIYATVSMAAAVLWCPPATGS
jgi:hypothetical protein